MVVGVENRVPAAALFVADNLGFIVVPVQYRFDTGVICLGYNEQRYDRLAMP